MLPFMSKELIAVFNLINQYNLILMICMDNRCNTSNIIKINNKI